MAVDARCAAWWARAMPPGVRPVGGVFGVRPDGGLSTAAPRGSAGRSFGLLLVDPTSAALRSATSSNAGRWRAPHYFSIRAFFFGRSELERTEPHEEACATPTGISA